MLNIFKMPFMDVVDGGGAKVEEPATPQEPVKESVKELTKEPIADPLNPAPSVKEPELAEPARDLDKDRIAASARREAENQAKALKSRQDNFAKQYGYNTFEELEHAQQVQAYVDKGVDPVIAEMKIKQDKLEQQIALQGHESRIAKEKIALQNAKFFKECEPEVDRLLSSDPSLSVDFVFKHVRGEKMDELLEKETKAAAQRQLNNINSKSHIKPDGGGIDLDNIKIDEEEFEIAKSLNKRLTRDEWVKFKKSQRS
jgi:Rps23 Pro-64 3,4-dihydroxylase Tpa1-like proline 4-hydroxylase